MRESSIEKAVCEYAKDCGWLVYKFVSPNNRGVPDRMFIKDGRMFFIEFKATGKRSKVTQLQTFKMTELMVHEFKCYVIDDIDMGKALFSA